MTPITPSTVDSHTKNQILRNTRARAHTHTRTHAHTHRVSERARERERETRRVFAEFKQLELLICTLALDKLSLEIGNQQWRTRASSRGPCYTRSGTFGCNEVHPFNARRLRGLEELGCICR